MKSKIIGLIKRIHYSIPPKIRKSYQFIFILAKSLGEFIIPVNTCSCNIDNSENMISVLHIGWDTKLLHYWLNRISNNYKIKTKLTSKWQIIKYIKRNKNKFDLALIEERKRKIHKELGSGYLLPRWIEMILDIEQSIKKSRINNIKRNIKKNSLNFEIKNGTDAFNLFYYEMYLPFAIKRHGKSADITDYKHFLNLYKQTNDKLFFIIKDSEPIAAAYVENRNKIQRISAFGIKDANDSIFKMGVIGALYYFVMNFYYEVGSKSIKIGKSMPIIFDGVTEFKLQIGATPSIEDLSKNKSFYFFPLNNNTRVHNILKLNPMYFLFNQSLKTALFLEDSDFSNKQEFSKYIRRLKIDKVGGANIYYRNYPEKVSQWLKEFEMKNIEFEKSF